MVYKPALIKINMSLLKQIGLGLVDNLRINYGFITNATLGEIPADENGIKISTRGTANRPVYCFYLQIWLNFCNRFGETENSL